MQEIISLKEAQKRLDRGKGPVMICLEPDEILEKKTTPDETEKDKSAELWVFNSATGESGRIDDRFFKICYVDRGGWGQLGVYEEPHVLVDEYYGFPLYRIVGHVIIDVAPDGRVQSRKAKGLEGEILELKPSSVSKGELVEKEMTPAGYFLANPQRIMGYIAVYLNPVPAAEGEGWMLPRDFVAASTDGRSITALTKAGLL